MPPYSTSDDVKKRLPAASTAEGSPTVGIIAEGIEYADSVIDAKLGARYTVPFPLPPPKLIKGISADLAAAFALDGSFSGGGEDDETPLSRTIRKRAMDLLDQLAAGDLVLPKTEPPGTVDGPSSFGAYHTRMGQTQRVGLLDL